MEVVRLSPSTEPAERAMSTWSGPDDFWTESAMRSSRNQRETEKSRGYYILIQINTKYLKKALIWSPSRCKDRDHIVALGIRREVEYVSTLIKATWEYLCIQANSSACLCARVHLCACSPMTMMSYSMRKKASWLLCMIRVRASACFCLFTATPFTLNTRSPARRVPSLTDGETRRDVWKHKKTAVEIRGECRLEY